MWRKLKRPIYCILTRTSLIWQCSEAECIWLIVHPLSQSQISLLVSMTLLSLCWLYPAQFPYHVIGLCLYLPISFLLVFNLWCWECVLVHQPLLLRDGITLPKIFHLHCRRLGMADHSLCLFGLRSGLNHSLHQGEPLSTPLPIKGSLVKIFRELIRCFNIYLPTSPWYVIFWTHYCIFMKYDKGTEISETGCSYKIYVNRWPGQRDIWEVPTKENITAWAGVFINPGEYTPKRAHQNISNAEQASVTIHIFQTWESINIEPKIWRKSTFISSNIHELILKDWKEGTTSEALLYFGFFPLNYSGI